MRFGFFLAAGLGGACYCAGARIGAADEPLEAPAGVQVCQIAYGADSAALLSWSNGESYDTVEFSLDDTLAPGTVDGTFGAGRVQGSPGQHLFGVRGLVGERRSPWSTAEFTLLEESPLVDPIASLKCELIPGGGGTLKLHWELGAGIWVSGRLEVPGQPGGVDIPEGATSAQISLIPPSDGDPAPASPQIARVSFKNAQNYFSEPMIPICPLRGPSFRRGDCDSSGNVNITDSIVLLNHLFLGGRRWSCDDACDANDDGKIDLSDPISTLSYLFQGGDVLPTPGPRECNSDPSDDFLGGVCTCGV